MARTDENGREVQAVLGYLLNRAVPAKDIYGALGIARNTYHKREEEDSYPNAEEARLLGDHFELNPIDLMLRFGLILERDLEPFRRGTGGTKTPSSRLPKIQEMERDPAVSPL